MTLTSTLSLLDQAPFDQLSEASKAILKSEGKLLSFELGQPLTSGQLIGDRVLVVLDGQARVLSKDHKRLFTLEKVGPGAIVGLCSLLRASPCETVAAASKLVALAIPDRVILDLLKREPNFARWCHSTLWLAEFDQLLSTIEAINPRSLNRSTIIQEAWSQTRLCQGRTDPDLTDPERVCFMASANGTDTPFAQRLEAESWPSARPPLPPRVVSVPAEWLERVLSGGSSSQPAPSMAIGTDSLQNGAKHHQVVPAEAIETATLPGASALDLGSGASPAAVTLIRASSGRAELMACLQMLAKQMGVPFRRDGIERVLLDAERRGQELNIQLAGQLAGSMHLYVVGAVVPTNQATRLEVPALMAFQDGFGVVTESNSRGLTVAVPSKGWLQLSISQLENMFPEGITVVLVDRLATSPERKFDFSWFLPAIKRYRLVLSQVLLASFVVQLFSLANPLLIQVIIDKVISQRSLDTLQVMGLALVVVTVLEGVIGSLRTFLFAETTNRIDLRLGSEVIDHLLRLPLSYYDRRPVGELSTRIAELEKIRSFLTGQALTTILDALFSVIYIVVMVLYSLTLTAVALAVLPIQIGITVLGTPLFRRQNRQVAEDNAKTQSHLVEVLTGIQTVKAQNVEMVSRWKWQDLYSTYIERTFNKTITVTALSQTSQVLQKLSQLLVLWVGASFVLKGELTLGQLIAFRIISGYVTQPLLRLTTIWQNIVELKVSFERLADVVDSKQESDDIDQQKISLPPIHGEVEFDHVSFAFPGTSQTVLKDVSVKVPAGTFVGVVGQSGSGKSTLMKLVSRLYSPDSGRILIDSYDIDKVQIYSLRRQIGIVPQDPLLFSGNINENIALTNPEASSESIVQAARIACAHEFVMELSSGYSTSVGERGSGLSGGQRQRIAIARTILSNPNILVLDEATSALDYQTERQLCDNLKEHYHNRTVFFITHRLTTIRQADLILMLHKGVIVEQGTHTQLMDQRGRYYALYRQQEAL
ncbi:peptidase domain-containing ABC transporter [Synechococcus sp. 1G10]|uniref:peptidase domain-containing ABC transporter n=1 Tax=Synechococcus sp. 1G10 TaxID=2025605 RepID=UPI000B9834F5|nr:peptidase domain-containing ABC transporter [Synechococcus sp. 1G10]